MDKAEIMKYDKELNDFNNQLLDIAHKLKANYDLDESAFAIMKIEAASLDIHRIRIKLINGTNDGVQQK